MHWRYRLRGFKDCRSQKQQNIYQPFRKGEPLEKSSRSIWLKSVLVIWPLSSLSFPKVWCKIVSRERGVPSSAAKNEFCQVLFTVTWAIAVKESGAMDNYYHFLVRVIAWFVVIFGINTTSEIWDNFEIKRVVFMPNITYKSCYYLFILPPAKGLKFSHVGISNFIWNTTALSQLNCRNLSFSNIKEKNWLRQLF